MELRALANRAPLIPFLKAKPTSTWVKPDKSAARVQLSVYIDRRAVEHILDAVAGPDRWTWDILQAPTMHGKDWVCHGRLSIILDDGRTVFRDGIGTNSSGEAEMGAKGAESDALKRAAAAFGLGRALSALGNVWTGAYIGKGDKATIYNPASGKEYGKTHPEVLAAVKAWGDTLQRAAARDVPISDAAAPDLEDDDKTAGTGEDVPAVDQAPDAEVPPTAPDPPAFDTPVSQTVLAAINHIADLPDPKGANQAAWMSPHIDDDPPPARSLPPAPTRVITRHADGSFTVVFTGDGSQEVADTLDQALTAVATKVMDGCYRVAAHAGPILVGPNPNWEPFADYFGFTVQDEPAEAPASASSPSPADEAAADAAWAATATANASEPVTPTGGPVVVDPATGEVLDADAVWQEGTDGDVDQRWAVLVAHFGGDEKVAWDFAREKGGAKGKAGLGWGSIWRAIAVAAGKQTTTQKAA